MSIVIALIIFSVMVLFHEFGHFIVAKANKIVVNEFSLGMGPRLISKKFGETVYSIKILPFGGSCAMLGEDEATEVEGSFNSKSVWARMAVVFAGPFFNFILAFMLSLIVVGCTGADISYVTEVKEDSAAYAAGLRPGDRVLEYNGARAVIGREIRLEQFVNPLDGSDVVLKIERDGEEKTITYKPDSEERFLVGMTYTPSDSKATIMISDGGAMQEAGAKNGDVIVAINGNKITSGKELEKYLTSSPWDGSEVDITVERRGKEHIFTMKPRMSTVYSDGLYYNLAGEKQSFLGVLEYSVEEVRFEVATVFKSLGMLVTGKVSTEEMSGPVGIVDAIGSSYDTVKEDGFEATLMTMLGMAIMLSANLGVMNLLPIPALDGGRLVLLIIEAIRRKPINRNVEGMIHFVGFILLMALMVFLIFNDVGRLF